MGIEPYLRSLQTMKACFDRTISCLGEEHETFTPVEGMFTVAQQIAHTAQSIEWFMEGAFRPEGMDLAFDDHIGEVRAVTSMEDALAWWNSAVQEAEASVSGSAPEAWDDPIRGEILAGTPRHAIFEAMADHTAHHRGALAVYARLLGLDPPMPYGGD
jgi:uncharacterized damage-inducible protein DinB